MPTYVDTAARTVDEQFLDLILSDADLLADEFDAIIVAGWLEPPADQPGRGDAVAHPDSVAGRRAAKPIRGPVPPARRPGIGGWARQRSPPWRDSTHDRQEGR